MQQRTYISGAAVASAIGSDLVTVGERLKNGVSGLTHAHAFGEVTAAPLGMLALNDFDIEDQLRWDPDLVLELVLFRMIERLAEATGVFRRYRPEEIGFFFGTTSFGMHGIRTLVKEARAIGSTFAAQAANGAANRRLATQGRITERVAARFPIAGVGMTFSSACSSGAVAVSEGAAAMNAGLIKCCLAGGLDVLSPLVIKGFESLQIVDQAVCRPFESDRAGINLGEGGALVLLETEAAREHLGELLGSGMSSEAYHMTSPNPDGSGMMRAMRAALQDGGVAAADVAFLNAHATGTLQNDAAEMTAIRGLWPAGIKTTTSKNLTGHTLAGAGALELVLTCLGAPRTGSPVLAMNNSFGFGGSNVAQVLRVGASRGQGLPS